MGSNDGGFSFDLCKRNALLERKGMAPPRAWKTGTTIAGVVYKVREASRAIAQPVRILRVRVLWCRGVERRDRGATTASMRTLDAAG